MPVNSSPVRFIDQFCKRISLRAAPSRSWPFCPSISCGAFSQSDSPFTFRRSPHRVTSCSPRRRRFLRLFNRRLLATLRKKKSALNSRDFFSPSSAVLCQSSCARCALEQRLSLERIRSHRLSKRNAGYI